MCCYFFGPIPIAAAKPLEKRPRATYLVLALNAGIWMLLNLSAVFGAYGALPAETSEKILDWLAFTPAARNPWSYVTSAFTQESFLHLLSNLFFLWIFGCFLEERLGWRKYLALLILGGVAGCVAHDLTLSVSREVLNTGDEALIAREMARLRATPLIGASGAVFTILGAYLVLLPSLEFKCFYVWGILWHWTADTITIPAAIYIPFWVMIEEVVQFYTDTGSAIAHSAHLGGFATGVVVALLVRLRPKREKTVRLERKKVLEVKEAEIGVHYENFKRALEEGNPTVALALLRESEKTGTPLPLTLEDKLELGAQMMGQGEYSVPKRIYLQLLAGDLAEEVRLEVSLRLCRILLTFERDLESSKELLRTLYRRYRENERIGDIRRMIDEVKDAEKNLFKRQR